MAWRLCFCLAFLLLASLSLATASLPVRGVRLGSRKWVTIDGNKVALAQVRNDTLRPYVSLTGYDVAESNSLCGIKAWLELDRLLEDGEIMIEGEPDFDEQGVAYMRGMVADGSDLATLMVRKGLGSAATSRPDLETAADTAASRRVGCIWNRREQDQFETTAESNDNDEGPIEELLPSAGRLIESNDFPSGFTKTRVLGHRFARPVDFDFVPGTNGRDIIVAENKGYVKFLRNSALVGNRIMDLTSIASLFQDRGIMSMAISPTYVSDHYVFFFFVYEHRPGPAFFEGPKTSTVMKTRITGASEDVSSRQFILGTVHVDSCASLGPSADCIPTEGKSHVGGALAINSAGAVFVSVGDGAIATVNAESLRPQSLAGWGYSGKILKITMDGDGYRSNPFAVANLKVRRSKIWAYGYRNPLHCHVSPDNQNRIFCGDTQWNTMEEVDVIEARDNGGWPCYEGSVRRPEYARNAACSSLAASAVKFPLVEWRHGSDTSHSTMIGPKIKTRAWPELYQNCIVYGDISNRVLGFAKVDNRDRLIDDVERIKLDEAIVQARMSPQNALYYTDIRLGFMHRITYTPSTARIRIVSQDPRPGTSIVAPRKQISMTFSRSLDPRTVENNIRLRIAATNAVVPATIVHQYSERVVVITPRDPYTNGVEYRVDIPAAVRDLDGRGTPGGTSWTFTPSSGALDVPAVMRTTPTTRATNVPIGTWVAWYFNVAINDGLARGNIHLYKADSHNVPTGPRLPIVATDYRASDHRLRARGNFENSQMYVFILPPQFIRNLDGVQMPRGFRLSFTTEAAAVSRLTASIANPKPGLVVTVGDRISFNGDAHYDGNRVPATALTWTLLTVHCKYDSNSCHDHTSYVTRRVRSGTFNAVNHEDRFKYQVVLSVNYNGLQAESLREVNLRTVKVTLRSEPPGAQLSVNGYTAPAPYTVDVAVNSNLQISAQAEFDGRAFQSWSCGGARTNTRKTPGVAFECTARFSGGTPTYNILTVTPALGGNPLPLTGFLTVDIVYSTTGPGSMSCGLRTLNNQSRGGQGRSLLSTGGRPDTLRYFYRIKAPMTAGTTYQVRTAIFDSSGNRLQIMYVRVST